MTLYTAFKLALALVDIARSIFRYLERQGFIDEGRAQLVAEQARNMENEVFKARVADAAVAHDPDSVQNDPDNRDRDAVE